MKNKLEIYNNSEKIKQHLSKKTIGIIFGVSTLATLIVGGSNLISGTKNNISFENPMDTKRYEQIVNEFSFTDRGFIKTIQDKNPELILNKDLQKHENKILRLSRGNIKNGNLYFSIDLSKENINDIKVMIESLSFLMDTTYGKGYSNILKDEIDHNDKILVIDIKKYGEEYKLRKLSINDKKIEQSNNDTKQYTKKLA